MAPVLNTVYPADGDVGIPLGVSIVLTFDRSVDLETIKRFVAITGDSNDQVSGPEPGSWLDKRGEKPYLFRSPSFKGLVPYSIRARYVDGSGNTVVDDFADFAAEGASSAVGYEVTISPNKPLAEENVIEYQVIGDPDTIDTGVSARTVWNVVPDVGNASTDGVVEQAGSFTGDASDTLVITIDSSGNVGAAKYSWHWDSIGVGTGKSGKLTNTGFLTADKGVAVRFSGSNFVAGDIFRINVEPTDRMVTSTKVGFTTTDNEYTTAPDSPSTPAEASPPATAIPPIPGFAIAESLLRVLDIDPYEGAYNISVHTDEIVITFSDPLDPATVTKDTVQLYTVPAEGIFGGQGKKTELAYSLSVSGDTLTISF